VLSLIETPTSGDKSTPSLAPWVLQQNRNNPSCRILLPN
jgi:hypothetical protein